MTVPFDTRREPATAERIRNAETELGLAINPDYRAFLLKHDGARPADNEFHAEGGGRRVLADVETFLGIDAPGAGNLLTTHRQFGVRLPEGMLTIAHCGGGDHLCMLGDDPRVFLHQHELEADDDDAWAPIMQAAPDLGALLESMQPEEKIQPDDPRLKGAKVKFANSAFMEEQRRKGNAR